MNSDSRAFLPRENLAVLLEVLCGLDYRIVGPRVRDGAVVFDTLATADDLPHGVGDRQSAGEYRLGEARSERCFAFANGPQALKPLLFPPRVMLWRMTRGAGGRLHFEDASRQAEAVAVIGARACDLAAMALNDRHFRDGPYPDPDYVARREKLLLVAVDCSHPAQTCFCVSTGDGPVADAGYDLALSELDDGFLVRTGSATGEQVAACLPLQAASGIQHAAARDQTRAAAAAQTRSLPGRDLRATLFANLDHPRWEHVAERCLACGNCTSVCPTCFCHAQSEQPSLGGAASEHLREWDSCFTQRHCEMHGYKVRPHIRQRYRQWLTHKLGSWHEQYGRSGCVGCGRCIAWCPVGIDLTEEAHAVCDGTAAAPAP